MASYNMLNNTSSEILLPMTRSDCVTMGNGKTFQEELNNSNTHYLIASENDEIIGFGGISVVLDESTLNNIAIRIDKRNC